ncbi:MAG: hypothetical protein GFH27_549323n2 [Chloroflexi bacterium AL-W]|nr:hypothetical protein [Chloroflexi bacterium AL-N1]NOK70153.1 hypothetical protein [Chloroflexi bacterium AL-N10]NOK77690.1 hypothetical protein [Chloroflexi bacterium AL-N5]NOK84699.1 hypothetical protein [Chloroflexi bacterium AL-W]NOK93238.1 hypothetical protein [Chloroflexi bacterium AL-N15]
MTPQERGLLILGLITFGALFLSGAIWLSWRVYIWRINRRIYQNMQQNTPAVASQDKTISVEEIAHRAIACLKKAEQRIEKLEAELQRIRGVAIDPAWDWLTAFTNCLHLLVIGHSRGGKTTVIHEIATRRIKRGETVFVCDPDAAKGMWPGCDVAGYNNDYKAINQSITRFADEMEARRKLRSSGIMRTFAPVHLIIDEYADVVEQCDDAQTTIEHGLRRWGKLNGHIIIGVQDKQVKTMKMEGQGELRKNFEYTGEIYIEQEQRQIMISNASKKLGIAPVPELTDPESLIIPIELDTSDAERLLERLFITEHVLEQPEQQNTREQHQNGTEQRTTCSEHKNIDKLIEPEQAKKEPQTTTVNRSENTSEDDTVISEEPPTLEELPKLARAIEALAKGEGVVEAIYFGWGLKRGGGPKYKRARYLLEAARSESEV